MVKGPQPDGGRGSPPPADPHAADSTGQGLGPGPSSQLPRDTSLLRPQFPHLCGGVSAGECKPSTSAVSVALQGHGYGVAPG